MAARKPSLTTSLLTLQIKGGLRVNILIQFMYVLPLVVLLSLAIELFGSLIGKRVTAKVLLYLDKRDLLLTGAVVGFLMLFLFYMVVPVCLTKTFALSDANMLFMFSAKSEVLLLPAGVSADINIEQFRALLRPDMGGFVFKLWLILFVARLIRYIIEDYSLIKKVFS